MVKNNPLYDETKMLVFQADITSDDVTSTIAQNSLDLVTLIFVLSAIHPEKFVTTLQSIRRLLKPGGLLLFRDYGLHDMAQLRFKPGCKISENFYVRQDGTRSYYFSTKFTEEIFHNAGFKTVECNYVHRRTVNVKEAIDVPRIFVQGKFMNPVA